LKKAELSANLYPSGLTKQRFATRQRSP
jgi:hypothetical protein